MTTSDTIDINTGNCHVCCIRLCSDRFDSASLRSKSAAISEKDLVVFDKANAVRGKWNNRIEFLLSCIGFSVGLGNVWRFPIRCYESGGGAFLIPYTLLCLALGVPILMLELGLAQFSGRGPTKAFKIIPVFFGIGWAMIVVSYIIDVYYAAIIAWSYFYLFGSLAKTMPWTVCSNYFNTANCLASRVKRSINDSSKYVSSTSEYWDYYVTGFVKYPSRQSYTMNEYPGAPQWHLSLCLLVTWVVCGLSLMYGVKVSGRVMYFSVLYPYFALFCLFCLGCSLPGASIGIKYYLTPDWTKIYKPKILRGAVEQLFFSASIAMGGMLTYASYNDFRDNFYRDSIIIIFVDYLTSLLAGFAVFPILGYMAQRNGVHISKVITSGSSLFFITFTEALATLPGAQFWTVLLMLMAISLGMDSQFAMIEAIITGIYDAFSFFNKSIHKVMLTWGICLSFFLGGLLIISPGGKFWFEVLDGRVSSFGLPLIALAETICVGSIYGIKQFRYDIRMMTGYSLGWYWFVMMGIGSPIIISGIILASLITLDKIKVDSKPIPVWGEVLAALFLLLVLMPIVAGMIQTIVKYKKKYPDLKGNEFFKKLISPPVYWGPIHKMNWLLSDFYRKKLLKYKDDPRFLKYVQSTENINSIAQLAGSHAEPTATA